MATLSRSGKLAQPRWGVCANRVLDSSPNLTGWNSGLNKETGLCNESTRDQLNDVMEPLAYLGVSNRKSRFKMKHESPRAPSTDVVANSRKR